MDFKCTCFIPVTLSLDVIHLQVKTITGYNSPPSLVIILSRSDFPFLKSFCFLVPIQVASISKSLDRSSETQLKSPKIQKFFLHVCLPLTELLWFVWVLVHWEPVGMREGLWPLWMLRACCGLHSHLCQAWALCNGLTDPMTPLLQVRAVLKRLFWYSWWTVRVLIFL